MRTTGPETMADLILRTLEEGPRTGFEVCQRLEERHEVLLRGREGAIYPALLQLSREGYVEAGFEDLPDGRRRRLYRLPVLRNVTGREPEDLP